MLPLRLLMPAQVFCQEVSERGHATHSMQRRKSQREGDCFVVICFFFFLLGWYLSALDNVFLAIYFMEIVLKLYALRSYFFKTGWNIMGMHGLDMDNFGKFDITVSRSRGGVKKLK